MLYFAYGMNTNKQQMSNRCPKAVSIGAAVLPMHEFRFAVHADILENPEFDVHGVVWDITPDCLYSLDRLEGYPVYYERDIVTVLINGKPELAMTYYMTNSPADQLPSDQYLAMLYQGYAEHNVNTRQIAHALDYIRNLPVAPEEWLEKVSIY